MQIIFCILLHHLWNLFSDFPSIRLNLLNYDSHYKTAALVCHALTCSAHTPYTTDFLYELLRLFLSLPLSAMTGCMIGNRPSHLSPARWFQAQIAPEASLKRSITCTKARRIERNHFLSSTLASIVNNSPAVHTTPTAIPSDVLPVKSQSKETRKNQELKRSTTGRVGAVIPLKVHFTGWNRDSFAGNHGPPISTGVQNLQRTISPDNALVPTLLYDSPKVLILQLLSVGLCYEWLQQRANLSLAPYNIRGMWDFFSFAHLKEEPS